MKTFKIPIVWPGKSLKVLSCWPGQIYINIFSELFYTDFSWTNSCSHSCEIWCWYLSISTLIFTHIWHCPNRLLVHYWHIRYWLPTIHISSNVFNPAYYDHFFTHNNNIFFTLCRVLKCLLCGPGQCPLVYSETNSIPP